MNNEFNHPFYEVIKEAEALIQTGAEVFQKFTCENCGNRLTMDVPNAFYKEGSCDNCGHVTNIEEAGCNFLLVVTNCSESQEINGGQSEG